MKSSIVASMLMSALLAGIETASGAQLRVEPVLLELNAPAAAGVLKLRNDEDREVTVQTRVLRWTQEKGKERLDDTTDVVASPPIVTLAPRTDYVLRVVRVAKGAVRAEESYRIIVDQLPQDRKFAGGNVNLLIRQSIPVFFRGREVAASNVSWSIAPEAGKFAVVAANAGDERLRIASLRLKDSTGASISFGNGLVGYVLGRSSMSWTAAGASRGFGGGGSVTISAETDKGPIHAVVQAPNRQ
jgi:fimbrial chaperone protein